MTTTEASKIGWTVEKADGAGGVAYRLRSFCGAVVALRRIEGSTTMAGTEEKVGRFGPGMSIGRADRFTDAGGVVRLIGR